jgi:hypothetical protein
LGRGDAVVGVVQHSCESFTKIRAVSELKDSDSVA